MLSAEVLIPKFAEYPVRATTLVTKDLEIVEQRGFFGRMFKSIFRGNDNFDLAVSRRSFKSMIWDYLEETQNEGRYRETCMKACKNFNSIITQTEHILPTERHIEKIIVNFEKIEKAWQETPIEEESVEEELMVEKGLNPEKKLVTFDKTPQLIPLDAQEENSLSSYESASEGEDTVSSLPPQDLKTPPVTSEKEELSSCNNSSGEVDFDDEAVSDEDFSSGREDVQLVFHRYPFRQTKAREPGFKYSK